MSINEQLKNAIESIKFSFKLTQAGIAEKLGVKSTYLSDMINGRVPFSDSMKGKIYEVFSYNVNEEPKTDNKLIPFYDDVISIGGSEIAASIEGSNHPAEYVDAGDWFKDATAAIRHYGDSMIEYPSGCILALREVQERHLVLWGKDYVIETKEYRVTKRIQRGKDEKHITAYSTDMGTYPDGRQIHEPIDIAWEDIGRIFFVLGYVVKKNGGTMVFSNSKK